MQNALDILYYTFDKLLNFIFTSYFFDGVSIGMILICTFIFSILLNYLLAIPRLPVGGSRHVKED